MISRQSSVFRFVLGLILAWAVLWQSPHQWGIVATASASPPPGVPAELGDYWKLMSSIQGSVTGQEKDPGLFIRVDEKVGIGQYDAHMGVGDLWVVSVNVQSINTLSIPGEDPSLIDCTATMLLCTVTGPNGSVDMICMALKPHDSLSTQIYPMARADAVPQASSSLIQNLELTQPHRTSTPASVLDHTFDHLRNPSASCATLPADQRCICVAQKTYDDCMRGVADTLVVCMGIAAVAAARIFAVCAMAAAAIPGFNLLALGPCGTAALLFLAGAVIACGAYAYFQSDACMHAFFTNMEGCGWHWAQT